MRDLIAPQVCNRSLLAAGATALACYPRLAMWQPQPLSWMLAGVLFVCAFLMWQMVFGWHTRYSGCSLWKPDDGRGLQFWLLTTVMALAVATLALKVTDPICRQAWPQDYPQSLAQLGAMAAFGLSFNLLFLLFAPCAWSMRLTRSTRVSVGLSCALAIMMVLLKSEGLALGLPKIALLATVRGSFLGGLGWLYFRGGMPLVWWCALLLEMRHLVFLLLG